MPSLTKAYSWCLAACILLSLQLRTNKRDMPRACLCHFTESQLLAVNSSRGSNAYSYKHPRGFCARHCWRPGQSVCSTSAAKVTVSACVQPGTTPYGRGLVSQQQVVSGKRLLSIPFSQLLMLPDKIEGPFQTVHERFLCEHGSLPHQLLRFITGGLQGLSMLACIACTCSVYWIRV